MPLQVDDRLAYLYARAEHGVTAGGDGTVRTGREVRARACADDVADLGIQEVVLPFALLSLCPLREDEFQTLRFRPFFSRRP